MNASEVAKLADVTIDTVRHYTRKGLLNPLRNPDNNYKIYRTEDVRYLRFIQKARLLGFSLQEIGSIVNHQHIGISPCLMVRNLMDEHLPKTRKKITDLQEQLKRMEKAMRSWEEMPDGLSEKSDICPLIEHWNNQEGSNNK